MADMDQGVKRLLQAHPADIIQLALPDAEYLAPIETDVATEPQLVLDTLFRIRYQGEDCGVNVEIQGYPDPTMPRRCYEYGSRASIVHQLPIFSVVLWLERRGPLPPTPYIMQIENWRQAIWEIINVEVYNLAAEADINAPVVGLLPLTPFMRGAHLATAERAATALKERASAQEADALGALLAVFLARFQGAGAAYELMRRLAMNTSIMDESPLFQEWKERVVRKATDEGLREGLREGLQEAAQLAIESRFGPLDPAFRGALAAADTAMLRALMPHLATEMLDQLRARLQPADPGPASEVGNAPE